MPKVLGRALWPAALDLMSHLESMISHAHWTFGGGTVLMLRYDHRFSKDIDLFVRISQYLGHVNPRLGGPAEDLTSEYEVNAEFVKLFLLEGEIDVVVGAALTGESFVVKEFHGRPVRVETCRRRPLRPGACTESARGVRMLADYFESNTAVFALAKEMSSLVGLTRAERMSR
jgi:hypothetical protein